MNARDGSATRSEAVTSAAAPALARWKCTEERAGVDAGDAAPEGAGAGGDAASFRAPRMPMAVGSGISELLVRRPCFRVSLRGCVFIRLIRLVVLGAWP
jgi:hypothetical protein